MRDAILIEGLELFACIGAGVEERSTPQRLTVNLRMNPTHGVSGLAEDLSATVDYAVVCQQVQALARERSRVLLETLAEDIASFVLSNFTVAAVELELRKYILPETAFVAVQIRRPL